MKPMPELRLVCDHTLYLARFKAPAKQSQHCWAQHVARIWSPHCDMFGVVGSSLKMVKFEPTTPNMTPHFATGCHREREPVLQARE